MKNNDKNNLNGPYRVVYERDMKNIKTRERLLGAGIAFLSVFMAGALGITTFYYKKTGVLEEELENKEPIEVEIPEETITSQDIEEDIQKEADKIIEKYETPEEGQKESEVKEQEDTNTYKTLDIKSYTGKNSITSLLKEMDLPTDKKFRAQLAVLYGIVEKAEDYKGTAAQNNALLKAILERGLIVIIDENGNIIGFKTEDDIEIIFDEEIRQVIKECVENKNKPKRTGGGSKGHKTETQSSETQSTNGVTQTGTTTGKTGQTQGNSQTTTSSTGNNNVNTDNNNNNENNNNNNNNNNSNQGGSSSGGNTGGESSSGGNSSGGNTGGESSSGETSSGDNQGEDQNKGEGTGTGTGTETGDGTGTETGDGDTEEKDHGNVSGDKVGGALGNKKTESQPETESESTDVSFVPGYNLVPNLMDLKKQYKEQYIYYQNLKFMLNNEDSYILARTKDDNHNA